MDKKQIDALLKTMLDEKVNEAQQAMGRMKNLEKAWKELILAGFKEGAEAMRNTIFLYLLTKPEATELEVVEMLAQKVNYKL